MSPPLAEDESTREAPTPEKTRCVRSPKQRAASAANGRASRGPGPEAKKRTRYNARKHDLRSESALLPGENPALLAHRLKTWPILLKASGEVELAYVERAVHVQGRCDRAVRSEDSATERHWLAFQAAETDRQQEEARLLGLELDNDIDPAGATRKLYRSPAGCTLILNEMTRLQITADTYGVLFWTQADRFFHLLGRRLRDLFTDDPVIMVWAIPLLGSIHGDAPDKVEVLSRVLTSLRPEWMDDVEYGIRIEYLARKLPDRTTAIDRVRMKMDALIRKLKKRLQRARDNAQYLSELDREAAWVDDSPDGARRLNYKLGHYRAFDSVMSRIQAAHKERRANGETIEADFDDSSQQDETPVATEPVSVVATATESVVTIEPILTAAEVVTNDGILGEHHAEPDGGREPGALVVVTEADVLGAVNDRSVLITNDPENFPVVTNEGVLGDHLAEPDVDREPGGSVVVTKVDVLGAVDDRIVLITNDPETRPSVLATVAAGHDPIVPVSEPPPDAVTIDPLSLATSVTAVEDEDIDWCAGARDTPRSADEPSWRDFLRPAPPMPPEWYSDAGPQRAGEPPPDRPPA